MPSYELQDEVMHVSTGVGLRGSHKQGTCAQHQTKPEGLDGGEMMCAKHLGINSIKNNDQAQSMEVSSI